MLKVSLIHESGLPILYRSSDVMQSSFKLSKPGPGMTSGFLTTLIVALDTTLNEASPRMRDIYLAAIISTVVIASMENLSCELYNIADCD